MGVIICLTCIRLEVCRRNGTRCHLSLHQGLGINMDPVLYRELGPVTRPGTKGKHTATGPPELVLMRTINKVTFMGSAGLAVFGDKHCDNRNKVAFYFPLAYSHLKRISGAM